MPTGDSDPPGAPPPLHAVPGSARDADAVLELLQAWDVAETGEIDTDMTDVLTRLPDPDEHDGRQARLIWRGPELAAAAFLTGIEAEVYARPGEPAEPALEQQLLTWLTGQADAAGCELQVGVAATATDRQERYAQAGLRHTHSQLQYSGPLSNLPPPHWPAGVLVRDWDPQRDARVVHTLIRDAFASVPGQVDRDWSAWSVRVLGRTDTEVLTCWDEDELIAAAVLSSYEEYGHLRELAVEASRRGDGLGLAMLLATFQRLARHGLPEVRVSVLEANEPAVRLYTKAGMTVLTEWQLWTCPPQAAS